MKTSRTSTPSSSASSVCVGDGDSNGGDVNHRGTLTQWFQRKIDLADMKLQGYSSAYVMLKEFEMTQHASHSYASRLRALIEGKEIKKGGKIGELRPQRRVRDHNAMESSVVRRARRLREDVHIETLLTHAADPAILARTWQGWMPFV